MKIKNNFYKYLFVVAIFICLLLIIKLVSCDKKKENFENKSKFINEFYFPDLTNKLKKVQNLKMENLFYLEKQFRQIQKSNI